MSSMDGALRRELVVALADIGIIVPWADNALPALWEAAAARDLAFRIDHAAYRRPTPRAFRAVVWSAQQKRGVRERLRRPTGRGFGESGVVALARALLDAHSAGIFARARSLVAA